MLRLDDALRIAGDRSPTLAEARHSLEISRRELEAQRAGLKSRFGLTVTPFEHTRNRTFNELVSGYNTQEQTHAGARFSIQQTIEPTDGTLSLVQAFDWRDASSSFAGAGSRRSYSNALFLRYSQPLFTYNRTRLALRRLELGLENSHLQFAHAGAADREPGDAPVPRPLLPAAQPGHRHGGAEQRRGEPGDRPRQGGGRHHRPRGAAAGPA